MRVPRVSIQPPRFRVFAGGKCVKAWWLRDQRQQPTRIGAFAASKHANPCGLRIPGSSDSRTEALRQVAFALSGRPSRRHQTIR